MGLNRLFRVIEKDSGREPYLNFDEENWLPDHLDDHYKWVMDSSGRLFVINLDNHCVYIPPENRFQAMFEKSEGKRSTLLPSGVDEDFVLSQAKRDPDVRDLLRIQKSYQPGDMQRRKELFFLLDKKYGTSDSVEVGAFLMCLDHLFPDAIDLMAAWTNKKRKVLRLLGLN